VKYQFIKNQKATHRVSRLCEVLAVPKSGFYDWLRREVSHRSKQNQALLKKIMIISKHSNERYGSPRIHAELQAVGERVGKNRVAKLMRSARIQAKMHQKFKWVQKSRAQNNRQSDEENHLNREFNASKPNEKWVSDITQVKTRKGWLYLAMIMDLYSRRIIGWSMASRNTERLAMDALEMTISCRGNAKNVLLHSDQGVQYTSWAYRQKLKEEGIMYSLSRKGNCWDNAPAESFFHTLKTELVMFEDYNTINEAKMSLFSYIESFYNRKRRHSTIGYMTPHEYEDMLLAA
jgi:transposase InsO family protein